MRGQRVLELGAGIGMLGFSLAATARQVFVTDVDPKVLRVARANAQLNGLSGVVDVQHLAYGRAEAEAFRARFGRFDHVVGADIVYGKGVIQPILESVDELLAEDGTFWLGFVDRDAKFGPALQAVAHEFGFEQSRAPCWLAKELGDLGPPQEEDAKKANCEASKMSMGVLGDLREMLRRIPDRTSSSRETGERVQLLEFQRRTTCVLRKASQAHSRLVAIDLNAMD